MKKFSRLLNSKNLTSLLSLFDILHDGIIIFDKDMMITYANKTTYNLLGYAKNELSNKHLNLLIPPHYRKKHDTYTKEFTKHPQAREMHLEQRLFILSKHGEEIPISVSLNPFKTDEGVNTMVIIRNMQEWDAIEAKLVTSKKIEAISTFSSGIVHNVNNIITAIMGHVYLAKRTKDLDSINNHLDEINLLCEQTTKTVQQITRYAAGSRAENKSFSLNSMIDDVIRAMQANLSTQVHLNVKIPDENIFYYGDQNLLYQVINNLLVNAIHAIQASVNKNISIELKRLGKENKHCEQCDAIESIQINVSDTGYGIPAVNIDSIFRPFFSTKKKQKGTGLGLSMSKGAVEAHGGHLYVNSEEGKGSTFTICLPNLLSESVVDT